MKKLILLSLMALVSSAFSADVTWVGTAGGGDGFTWSDGLNWDTGTKPGSSDNAIITASSADVSVFILSTETITDLTLNGTAGAPFPPTPSRTSKLTIGFSGFGTGDLTVTGNATFNTGLSNLEINDGAMSVSGNLSFNGQTLAVFASQTLTVTGDITRTAGSIDQSGTTNIGGSYPSTGVVFGGSSTVNYNGSSNQSIANLSYDVLSFDGSGTKTIANVLTYNSFTFLSTQNVTYDTESPLIIDIPDAGNYGVLTFQGTGEKSISTDLTVSSLIIDATDQPTVNYSGTVTQNVLDATYQNLTFSNSGLKILSATPTVNGTFSAGAVDARYSGSSSQRILPGTYNSIDLTGVGTKLIDTLDVVVNSSFTANSAIISITDGELNLNGLVDMGTSTIDFGKDGDQDVPSYTDAYFNLCISGSGTKSIIDASSVSAVNDFIIKTNATFNLGSDSLILTGDFTNNGTFSEATGTVLFNGTTASLVNGTSTTSFYNLTLAKTADVDVTLSVATEILPLGAVTLSSANDGLVVSNGLILNADATGYAYVPEIPTGGSITGNVTTEAYFNASVRSWWHVSSPISGTTGSDWIDDVFITGDFTGNSNDDVDGLDEQSMYSFDESSSSTQNDSWTAFPASNVTNAMTTGQGYRIFIRDNSTSVTPKTVDHTGTLNQGNINVALSFTDNGDADNDGWNLIGNPYPATLDWGQVDQTDLAFGTAYVWNATTKSYDKSGTNISIAPFQAFFVKTTAAKTTLALTESMKTTSTSLQRTAAETNKINISIVEDDLERPFSSASTTIKINPLATANQDFDFDAGFLSRNLFKEFDASNLIDIASLSEDGLKLDLNTIPESSETQTIPLHVEFSDFDKFTINVNTENYSYGNTVLLEDKYLNQIIPLNANNEINYSVTTDNDPASKASDRFILQVGATPLAIDDVQGNSRLSIYPNPTETSFTYEVNWSYNDITLSIADIMGNTVYQENISNSSSSVSGQVSVTDLEPGLYQVSISSGDNVETRKLIIK